MPSSPPYQDPPMDEETTALLAAMTPEDRELMLAALAGLQAFSTPSKPRTTRPALPPSEPGWNALALAEESYLKGKAEFGEDWEP